MRSDFSSSRLVRLLGGWAPADAQACGDFAERLGLWLNAFDAIGLHAAHRSIKAIATTAPDQPSRGRATGVPSLDEDLQRVRATLARAIEREPLPADSATPSDAAYAPYRQRHLELQRQMEQMIAALRDHVRQAIGRVSPALRQLAALDAALEQLLAPREQELLPTVAALMERRSAQLRLAGGDGWQDAFVQDWRQALLAELELRLEPVAGMIDALSNELKNQQ